MLPKSQDRTAKGPDGTPGFAMGCSGGRSGVGATLGTYEGLGSEYSKTTPALPPSTNQFQPAKEQDEYEHSDDEVFLIKSIAASGGSGRPRSAPLADIPALRNGSMGQTNESYTPDKKANFQENC